jgi:hypothetical protein
MDEDIASLLTEEMDEETLSKMPLWFRMLREGYRKASFKKQSQL